MSQFDVSEPSLGTVIMPIFAFSGHSAARGVSPWTAENVTIFDVARWFARMGYHWTEVRFIEDFAQRRRNEYEGRPLTAGTPYSTYPRELTEVRLEHILQLHQLPPLPVGVHFTYGVREDVDMADEPSGENPPTSRPPSPGENHP